MGHADCVGAKNMQKPSDSQIVIDHRKLFRQDFYCIILQPIVNDVKIYKFLIIYYSLLLTAASILTIISFSVASLSWY